jgi:3-mercaptopyruvate sulfurtransferase SseA
MRVNNYTEQEQYYDARAEGKFKSRKQAMKYKPKEGHVPVTYRPAAIKKLFTNPDKSTKRLRIKHRVEADRYEPVQTSSSKYNGKGKLKYTWIALKIWEMFNDQERLERLIAGAR